MNTVSLGDTVDQHGRSVAIAWDRDTDVISLATDSDLIELGTRGRTQLLDALARARDTTALDAMERFAIHAGTRPDNGIRRVDPPMCGCTDCLTGFSEPLDRADWEAVKALLAGWIEDATGSDLDVRMVVTRTDQRGWDDADRWEWKGDRAEARTSGRPTLGTGRDDH